jgi:hypothetical protein
MLTTLYHYATKPFDVLKCLEKQNILSKSDKKKYDDSVDNEMNIPYYKQISLFFDKLPCDIIGEIYGKQHFMFYQGSVLYEHEVKVLDIDTFSYKIVETPQETEWYYNDDISEEEYHRLSSEYRTRNKLYGKSLLDFVSSGGKMCGMTRPYYMIMHTRSNWEKIKNMHAATVPHVMIYPKNGIIVPSSISRVIIE